MVGDNQPHCFYPHESLIVGQRLAYQSTGVIYGGIDQAITPNIRKARCAYYHDSTDIGTSPLYVYSSTFTAEPSYDDLLGVVSIIIWTLTLIVTFKYVVIVLMADDEGEGGTFAIYTLLARFVRFGLPKRLSISNSQKNAE